MNMLHVPQRTYSLSIRSGFPGDAEIRRRASAKSWSGFSSMRPQGVRTAFMAAMNAAFCPGGMHQHFFMGRSLFF
jgi:hypothetical protein